MTLLDLNTYNRLMLTNRLLPPGPEVLEQEPPEPLKHVAATRLPYILSKSGGLERNDIYLDDQGWRWRVLCRLADRPRETFPNGQTKRTSVHQYVMVRINGDHTGEQRVIETIPYWVAKVAGGRRYALASARPAPDMHSHTIDVFQRQWEGEAA